MNAIGHTVEHVDSRWCADLKCARCYSSDTWQKSVLATVQAALAKFPTGYDEEGVYTQWKESLDAEMGRVIDTEVSNG